MNTNQLTDDIEISQKTLGIKDFKTEFDLRINELKNSETANKNVFPLEVFPADIQEIIKATNADLNFPIDFMCA